MSSSSSSNLAQADKGKKKNINSWVAYPRQESRERKSYYSTIDNSMSPEILLDETYETIEHIPGLKTSLFPHQKTIVKAMLDLEMKREFVIGQYTIKISAGVLSEAVGSGKTIDILSVILQQKIPQVYRDISVIDMCDSGSAHRRNNSPHFASVVRKKFLNILKPTIVFAGVSVVNQWVSAIKTFTSLKAFAVFNVRDLQKLVNMMADKSINQYDVVIVKNGRVTREVKLPNYITPEIKNVDKTSLYIYNVLGNMRNFCWARVVVDDFDTIHLPSNAGIINGLFTWYISSTRKTMNSNRIAANRQFTTTAEMLMYDGYNCAEIMNNLVLFKHFNIRNSANFVKDTNQISSPKFYAYQFENPNNQYMGFLGLMGGTEANEVMEMLNGDAIGTAADRLGIKTDSVADIFQLMLGKQFDLYTKSVNVLDFISQEKPRQGRRTPMSENPDEKDTYNKTDLFNRRDIVYNYPNLKGLIETTEDEYTTHRTTSSVAIERVKSNIREGECPICTSELTDDDEDILILKCCGIIVCSMCCFGTIFPKKSSNGQCSNCRSRLTLQQLIYLNSNFNLDKIINEDLTEGPDEEEVKEDDADKEDNADKPKGPRTKMTAILEIINNKKPDEARRVDVNIENLMKGTHIMESPSYSKVLIFANYDETIQKIKEMLEENKIHYWKLGGTHNEIATTVDKFTAYTGTCVMIINSMKHCSGLNLQSATDLVFAHKMIDRNVETQVIGRGQRLGRTNQLKVHFMFYQNEYEWMERQGAIHEIPDTDEVVTKIRQGIEKI